jgi:hypothetical protein
LAALLTLLGQHPDSAEEAMKRRIAASFTALIWGFLAFLGYKVISGIVQQHAPGYPDASQWRYYIYFPLIMLGISVGLLILGKRTPVALFVTMWSLQLVIVLPFILAYTGGV